MLQRLNNRMVLSTALMTLSFQGLVRAGNYSDVVLATPGLSGYWRLNEPISTGTLTTWLDSSGNGHTGTQTIHPARVPTMAQPGPRPSDGFLGFEATNYSETFNRNQSILVADSADLNPGTGDFTLEGWGKTSSTSAVLSMLGKHDSTYNHGYLLTCNYQDYANHDAAGRFRGTASTGQQIDPPPPGFAGFGSGETWHYVVAVLHRAGNGSSYASSGLSVFLDGTLVGSVNSTALDGVGISTPAELAIGAATRDGGFGYIGGLDEMAVYHRALSVDDVTAHWNAAFTAGAINSNWNVDADGNWSATTNWSGSVPSTPGTTANFGTKITLARTVTVDTPESVGTINFSSPISYTIAGSSTLTLDVSSGQSQINVTAGGHLISAPVTLSKDAVFNSASGSGVALTGILTAPSKTITKSGAGTVQFESVRASTLVVSAGKVSISAKGSPNATNGTSLVGSLSINAGAQLDVANNSMVVDYVGTSPLSDVRLHIKNNEIVSSATGSLAGSAIGFAEASAVAPGTTSFAGVSFNGDAVLMKFTYAGDANLDGKVNTVDFNSLAGQFGTGATWSAGDFDYDGVVGSLDFNLLVANFGKAMPASSPTLGTVVPEPVSVGVVVIPLFALARRARVR